MQRATLWGIVAALAAFGAPAAAEDVRIVAMNVLSYGPPGSSEYNALVRVIEALAPDILLVQEATNDAGRVAFQTAFATQFPFRALSQPDAGGNRQHTFSRWPLLNPSNLYAGGFSRPTLRVDVDTDPENPGAELRVYNLHWKAGSTGEDADLRLAMSERIRQDIDEIRATRPDMRIVAGGDFNEQPNEPALRAIIAPQYDMLLPDEIDPNNNSFQTRPASGRNIDHFVVSRTMNAARSATLVFNTATFAPAAPPPPALPSDSAAASDHLAILYDFDLITFLLGDTNLDGQLTVSDIGPFVTALTNPIVYRGQFPAAEMLEVADFTGDGAVTVSDIGPFVAALTGL